MAHITEYEDLKIEKKICNQIDQLNNVSIHIMGLGYLWDPIMIEHKSYRIHFW